MVRYSECSGMLVNLMISYVYSLVANEFVMEVGGIALTAEAEREILSASMLLDDINTDTSR